MRTHAEQKFAAKATALGVFVVRAELFVLNMQSLNHTLPALMALDSVSNAVSRIQFKPKFYTIFLVFYAIALAQKLHAGLHDGQTDAASAIFPGSGLIHLVKLAPDFLQIV